MNEIMNLIITIIAYNHSYNNIMHKIIESEYLELVCAYLKRFKEIP